MRYSKYLFILGFIWLAGCSAKLNDGVVPAQPAYSGTNLPNPLVIYKGSLVPGVTLAPPSLPPPYNAGISINFGDTSVTPDEGTANIFFGVLNFNPTGVVNAGTFVGYDLVPASGGSVDLSSGGYTQAIFDAKVTSFASTVIQQIVFQAAGGTPVTISFNTPTAWAPQTVTMGVSQNNVSTLFAATFFNTTTAPLTSAPVSLYIDNLRFQ